MGSPDGAAGAASGVLNTIRQIGTVFGSAAIGAIVQNRLAASIHDEASTRAGELPDDVRGSFLTALHDAAAGGREVGAGRNGTSVHAPTGTPPDLADRFAHAATSAFDHGVVHAMRLTLVLPIAVIAIGAAACLLVRRPGAGGTIAGEAPRPVELGTSA
ncbi:hypothetical protein [Embleya sp. AB8]|uniref:hypothetical protein n=1 Tax=Embleya sp. AB8 TaxID=3156304 RepID=UPI003C780626